MSISNYLHTRQLEEVPYFGTTCKNRTSAHASGRHQGTCRQKMSLESNKPHQGFVNLLWKITYIFPFRVTLNAATIRMSMKNVREESCSNVSSIGISAWQQARYLEAICTRLSYKHGINARPGDCFAIYGTRCEANFSSCNHDLRSSQVIMCCFDEGFFRYPECVRLSFPSLITFHYRFH